MTSEISKPTDSINQSVLTSRGILDTRELVAGDYVYDAMTGEPIEVITTIKSGPDSIYRISYTDGRSYLYHRDQFVVTEFHPDVCHDGMKYPTQTSAHKVDSLTELSFKLKKAIDQFPLELKCSFNQWPLISDNYFIGPLLMFGDHTDVYVKLYSTQTSRDTNYINYILTHYSNSIKLVDDRDGSIQFFHKNGDRMTWCELLRLENLSESTIPQRIADYVYDSKDHRMQLIKGIFDFGFSRELTHANVAIDGRSDYARMKSFRSVLNSVGVTAHFMSDRFRKSMVMTVDNGNIPISDLFGDIDLIGEFANYDYPDYSKFVGFKSLMTLDFKSYVYKIITSKQDQERYILAANMLPLYLR